MVDSLPLLPISQERLQALVAALLVYQRYRREKTPPTEEQKRTLFILTFLIPKLYGGVGNTHEKGKPLWLTVEDVQVMKGGLTTLIDSLNRKASSTKIKKEMQRLKELKTMIEQTFKTNHD